MRRDTPCGADWEAVLSSAASGAGIVPDGSLGASRFAAVLLDLERVSGWRPMPVGRLSVAGGRFDGIETTIRDQTRYGPLETMIAVGACGEAVVPTLAEMLRIKTWLMLSRNAMRDYVDAEALTRMIGLEASLTALSTLDDLYPQSNGASAVQQAARQLAEPLPFDRRKGPRSSRRAVGPQRIDWMDLKRRCLGLAARVILGLVQVRD